MTDLRAFLHHQVDQGTVPGAIGLVVEPDQDVEDAEVVAAGVAALDGTPLRPDAIVRIQSMTKTVVSAAALRLADAGRLGLDDPVERWLPELADRRVLVSPDAPLDDTVTAEGPITVRHLLTNTSGYGMVGGTPLAAAMAANGSAVGAEPPTLGADDWLARLAELPLVGQPGRIWRYHHSYALLGILIARLAGRDLDGHLRADVFEPLGMVDTGLWTPTDRLDRLGAAFRYTGDELTETEPAGGGFYAGPPPFDVSHGELVSTARDFARFVRMLGDGGVARGGRLLAADRVRTMTTDQVGAEVKTEDSFFPGFWAGNGWGYGGLVRLDGPRAGRYGWSGGQGTHFFLDRDGGIAILLTQVEIGGRIEPVLEAFEWIRDPRVTAGR